MKYQVLIPVIAGIAAVVRLTCARMKPYTAKTLYLKMAASLCFVITGLCALACGTRVSALCAALTLGGLLAGLLGDIALGLKNLDAERKNMHIQRGFILFGAGHICYFLALYLEYGRGLSWYCTLLALAAGFAAGFIVTRCAVLWGNRYGKYFPFVAVYSGFLASAAALSLLCAFAGAAPTVSCLMPVGLFSFMISDLILSRMYFGSGHNTPADIICNYLFYYGAQFLIALSLIF